MRERKHAVILAGGTRRWADGIRALSADQKLGTLHHGGALAHPRKNLRSGETNRRDAGRPSQAIAAPGTHRGLGARRAA